MEMLGAIRASRARQRTRKKFKTQAYSTVTCIVKTYGLGKDFLKQLDRMKDQPAPKVKKPLEVKMKASLDPPPYSLVSQKEYELVAALLSRLSNPYLSFARTPEELVLSMRLYESNPSIQPHELLQYDFETLLLCENAKKELPTLERTARGFGRTDCKNGSFERGWDEDGIPVPSLLERIHQLQAFIAKVEHTERKTE